MNDIPKIIHYCWFGHGPKSDLMEMCLASWKKFYPEYEIIEWNESNFDVNQNDYCREAYEAHKWAFVSDYARLAIIYEYGGIYLDTDVEILKRFDHLLTEYGYLGFEHTSNIRAENGVNTGLGFAAAAGSPVVAAMLHDYDGIHFITDGQMDLTPCPDRNTKSLLRVGLVQNSSMQVIGDVKVYPYEYFCGMDIANSHPFVTENTYTIHHYSATWKNENGIKTTIKYKIVVPALQKMLGYKNYDRLIRFKKGIKPDQQ